MHFFMLFQVGIITVCQGLLLIAELVRDAVPLDRRHEFDMQVNNVQPLITSGTVKRVGLYHLWNRL